MNRPVLKSSACRWPVGILLLFHAWTVLDLISRWSVTYNEAGHISAGLACWYLGDFDLYSVNPPLPRMVATAPLLIQPGISLEFLSRVRWDPGKRSEFEIGKFFADTNALDFQRIVSRARLAGVIWVTLGGIVVWLWAGRLFGPPSGLMAITLWTFEPTITAHSALATSDVPAAVTGLIASYAFDVARRTGTWFHTLLAGVLLGWALLCKFTLLLLIPAWTIAWLLTSCRKHHHYVIHFLSMRERLSRISVVCFLALLVLNAGYGFSGTGAPLARATFVSTLFHESLGSFSDSWVGSLPCPVPTAYIRGIDAQQKDFEGGLSSYLRGELRNHGWWYYYFYAFAVKSPLGHLAVYALALMTILAARVPIAPALWTFAALITVVASMKTGFTSHLRYMLPAYPYMIILAGAAVSGAVRRLHVARHVIVAVSLLCSAASGLSTYPHLIGYFNELAGGPRDGWRLLGDSNIDWGQDWMLLDAWLAAHPRVREVHIALSNHVDQQLYIRQQYPLPRMDMSGYAVVDAYNLTRDYQWLLNHRLAARIGASMFVFEVRP